MRLQPFIAPDISAALLQIKTKLGADAVIVSTEKLADGQVKVMAAVETEELAFNDDEQVESLSPQIVFNESEIRQGLEYHGVLPVCKDKILANCRRIAETKQLADSHKVLSSCFSQLFKFYDILDTSRPLKMFMGVSGSGKSTGIAKAATLCKIKHQSCCIISTDNVRAGANQQLKAFAEILETPLICLRDAKDLYRYVQNRRQNYNIILIDTPGINPFVAKEVAQLRTYAEAVDAEMIMTMDAGKNAWDAVETADVFAGIGAGCLLPTRMDLIHRIGGVLSIAGLVGMRLGASGVSSSIADGIGSLNAAALSQLVLNTPSRKGR